MELFKGEELVVAFVRENEAFIADAKNRLETQKKLLADSENTLNQNRFPEDPLSIFEPRFELVDAYKCLKSVSFRDIEDVLSQELSKLCKEHLSLEIEFSQVDKRDAELRIRIKPKEYISTWNDTETPGDTQKETAQ